MRILGYTWNNLLIVILLGTTLVLFIKLPISSTDDRTLEESIFGLLERHRERNENKNKRVIGSGITDLVQNEKKRSKRFPIKLSLREKFFLCIKQKELVTSKKPNNYS